MGPAFDPALAEVLVERGHPERIAERRQLLAGIPFDAILTTNFDHFLVGDVPGAGRLPADPAGARRTAGGSRGSGRARPARRCSSCTARSVRSATTWSSPSATTGNGSTAARRT